MLNKTIYTHTHCFLSLLAHSTLYARLHVRVQSIFLSPFLTNSYAQKRTWFKLIAYFLMLCLYVFVSLIIFATWLLFCFCCCCCFAYVPLCEEILWNGMKTHACFRSILLLRAIITRIRSLIPIPEINKRQTFSLLFVLLYPACMYLGVCVWFVIMCNCFFGCFPVFQFFSLFQQHIFVFCLSISSLCLCTLVCLFAIV